MGRVEPLPQAHCSQGTTHTRAQHTPTHRGRGMGREPKTHKKKFYKLQTNTHWYRHTHAILHTTFIHTRTNQHTRFNASPKIMASAFMVVNDAFLDSILLRKLGILRSISTLLFAFPRRKVRLSLREMSTIYVFQP